MTNLRGGKTARPDPRHAAAPREDTLLQPAKGEMPRFPRTLPRPWELAARLAAPRGAWTQPALGRVPVSYPREGAGEACVQDCWEGYCTGKVVYGGSLERETHSLSGTLAAPAREPLPWGPRAVGTPCLTCPSPWGALCASAHPPAKPRSWPLWSPPEFLPQSHRAGTGSWGWGSLGCEPPTPQAAWTQCEPTCLGRRRPRPAPAEEAPATGG